MHKKFITLLLLLILVSNLYSQEYEDIKNQKIDFESFNLENMNPFLSKLNTFIGNDFDSLDIEILSKGPIIGSIIVDLASKHDSLTFGLLYQKLLEFKQIPQYTEIRTNQIISQNLMNRPADFNNWDVDKQLFIQLGFEGDLFNELELYIKKNSSTFLTYKTVLIGFSEQINNKNKEVKEANKNELEKILNSSFPYDEIKTLTLSKNENKLILLYFTGYACINCRKIEQSILFELEISKTILQNFIFVPLYVDDRKELNKNEQKVIKIEGRSKEIKTIGDKHNYYQISQFNISSQPYFVVLNSENKIIGTADYENNNTVRSFLNFLNDSLEKK